MTPRSGLPLLLVFLACFSTHLATYLARPAASYRVLALGGDGRAVGLIAAAGAFLPIFLALPMGRAADRGRTVRLLLGGAILVTAGATTLALSGSLLAMAVGNVVVGTGQLALMLAFQGLVAALSEPDQQDRNFGWFTAAASLGQLAGPLLGGWIMGAAAAVTLTATRDAFLLAAGSGIAILLACSGLIATLRRRLPQPRSVGARAHGGTRTLLGNRKLLVAIFTSFTVMSSIDVLTAYLPLLGEQRGLTPAVVGGLLAIRAGFSFVSRLLIPILIRGLGRLTVLLVTSAVAAVALVLLVLTDDLAVIAVLMAVLGLVLGLGQPLTMTWTVREAPPQLRSTALGLRLTGNRIAQAAAPAAAAAVSTVVGVAGPFLLVAALLTAATITVLPGWRAERGRGR